MQAALQGDKEIPPSSARWEDIVENAPIGVFRSTIDGRFIAMNPALAYQFGYASPQEMMDIVTDIPSQMFVQPEQRPALIESAMGSESFVRDEIDYRRKDGSVFTANLYMRIARDRHSSVPFLEGFVEDITDRRCAERKLAKYQANLEEMVKERTAKLTEANAALNSEIAERLRIEKALIESESKYRDLVESVNSIILRWKRSGEITFINAYAQRFFGYSEEEILGKNIMGTIVPYRETSGRILETLAADIFDRTGAYILNENENMKKDGERVWVAWTNRPIVNERKVTMEILSVGNDITRRKLAEDNLKRTLTELAIARDRAETADRLKSAFLASMSHELRTPLNSIIGFTGILLQGMVGPLNEEQLKQMRMVHSSAKHLLSLINDVLDISRIEAGELQIRHSRFNLRKLIEKSIRSFSSVTEKKGLSLTFEVAPGIEMMHSDKVRVEQVLLNLLGNAVKFTETGGVHLTCSREKGWISASIVDTGIGIKEADQDSLFRAFRQIDTGTTRKYDGTGLGLSICKRLVEILGGKIWVTSEWGVGSTFFSRSRTKGTRPQVLAEIHATPFDPSLPDDDACHPDPGTNP
jgi:PAS domain S-box-containing protein